MERIVTDKMNWLATHTNHDVILMTVWHDREKPAFELNGRISHIHLNVPKHLYPLALYRFTAMMEQLNPGVAIMFRAVGSFLASFTSWRGKMIYESHTPLQAMNHKWIYPLMMKRVERVVCLTDGDARNFDNAKRVEVIPNYCTLATPERWPEYNTRRVISVGRECYEKNHERLRMLWSTVQKRYPDWELQIHHNTTDITTAYMSGSIYAMTSRTEGFPLALVEAMTCGLPVIAFDCEHGPREIIEDGQTGYLIPYDDDKLFAEKLTYLMENPDVRERMGRAARESVKRFDKQTIMRQWLKILTHQ